MSSAIVEKVARAVLYEGYLLYPYRPSTLKNRHRWNFGVLYPPAWAAAQTGSDRSYFQMECLARCAADARLDVSIRFLRLVKQQAIEQQVNLDSLSIAELERNPRVETFSVGSALLGFRRLSGGVLKLTIKVANTSDCQTSVHDEVLLHSLISAHAVVHLPNGEFISQTDPPDELQAEVDGCRNLGVWPVLVGDSLARDTMLGSPIILYDYPQVAPESKCDLFDATEIDEILSLRILTLTDQEKEEMRHSDERARRILDDLEANPERLMELHGAIRSARVKKGDRVRLRPKKRADIFDTLLDGKVAIIEAVEQDFEGKLHFAVVIEDDPGRDLGEMRQAGHRFFFSADELEPVVS